MLVESHQKLTGNARFEGFAIDLATELSKVLGFNFTFKLVDDEKVIFSVSELQGWATLADFIAIPILGGQNWIFKNARIGI